MKRNKTLSMAVMLALIAGTLGVGLVAAAYAQGFGQLSGTVYDTTGKPYVDVTITFANTETNKATEVKTDGRGRYSTPPLAGGTYNIDLKVKGQVIYQTGLRTTSGTNVNFDINLKEISEKDKGATAEAEAKRAEAEKQFLALKTHYDAGTKAVEEMKAAQAQLAQTPKDQQAPIQEKINAAGTIAVTELNATQELMKPEDSNRPLILGRLGEAYEAMGKNQEAADSYQKAITMNPTLPANYNNLGNNLAKLGKVDDARAAYQKYVELNPADAALAWRNFGIVLYQANRMKESIEPLEKATQLDPKNPQAWLLLGIAKVNTMEFKTEGDKMTPVIQPGTIEAYQKAVELDPNGPIGAQAKQGLESLQAMGVGGIETKVGKAPAPPSKGRR